MSARQERPRVDHASFDESLDPIRPQTDRASDPLDGRPRDLRISHIKYVGRCCSTSAEFWGQISPNCVSKLVDIWPTSAQIGPTRPEPGSLVGIWQNVAQLRQRLANIRQNVAQFGPTRQPSVRIWPKSTQFGRVPPTGVWKTFEHYPPEALFKQFRSKHSSGMFSRPPRRAL